MYSSNLYKNCSRMSILFAWKSSTMSSLKGCRRAEREAVQFWVPERVRPSDHFLVRERVLQFEKNLSPFYIVKKTFYIVKNFFDKFLSKKTFTMSKFLFILSKKFFKYIKKYYIIKIENVNLKWFKMFDYIDFKKDIYIIITAIGR